VTIGGVFSGVGGLELGLEAAGLGPVVWQVEIDPYCRSVLEMHWPDVYREVTDVRDAGRATLPRADLICGGFPCQDISSGNPRGAGLDGDRSGLWWEFERVLDELRPSWVVVENVAGNSSRWVPSVGQRLERLGYQTLPVPLEARFLGAPHRRGRVFLVAHADRISLRQLQQRLSARPPHRVPAQAQPEHVADGGWPTRSELRRADDGVPGRVVDRQLRALGNAVVPQCAEVIGNVIQILEGE
jgi:DNA (cytosine-5)-methyltransferase 1